MWGDEDCGEADVGEDDKYEDEDDEKEYGNDNFWDGKRIAEFLDQSEDIIPKIEQTEKD